MTPALKPYPAYRDSGVEWLGRVPEHWEVLKLRQILRQVAKRNRADLPLLSVVREKGVVLRDVSSKDENRNFIPDDLSNYKVVRSGQFAVNKMKAWQGSYGVSGFDGIVSPAYFVFDLTGVAPDYFHTAIRSRAYVPFFTAASDGVRIGQWDLSPARMREIPFFVPPRAEQATIVCYLGYVDRRIRRHLRAKQKLIKLLEEQKHVIIHRAVTGQIDVRTGEPYPAYRDSGVEWLGRVPAHWRLQRLQTVAATVSSGVTQRVVAGQLPVRYLGTEAVYRTHRIDNSLELEWATATLAEAKRLGLRCGDIVLTTGSLVPTRIGIAAIVTEDLRDPTLCGSDLALVRASDTTRVNPTYLFRLLASHTWVAHFLSRARGTTIVHIRRTTIAEVPVVLPPMPEQAAIAEYLDKALAATDAAIALARREVELLRELRTRLIADVVTGKLDVREAAAALPDEAEEPGPPPEEEWPAEEGEEAGIDEDEQVLEEAGA